MNNELVGYSRAGDVFHYRWAARRCLNMLYPNSNLEYVDIEGSEEDEQQGEYVIDVSEYYSNNSKSVKEIKYFQLKHTTIHKNDPFHLSDFKTTIEGFSSRYRALLSDKKFENVIVSYILVTNRTISDSVKENIRRIQNGDDASKEFVATLEKYSDMSKEALRNFCSALSFDDSQGDYESQKELLFQESSKIMANSFSTPIVETLTAFIQKKFYLIALKGFCPRKYCKNLE